MSIDTLNNELQIESISVPLLARFSARQTYEPIGGAAIIRMQNGGAIKLSNWSRIRTTISADGNIPPGLEAVDYTQPLTLRCALYREVSGTGLQYALPTKRRTDVGYTPKAMALVKDQYVAATLALNGDVATITEVAGATHYRVLWWPELVVFADRPIVQGDITSGQMSWTLNAEEI